MAGWTNNDRPPVPQGITGSAQEGRDIVPRTPGQDERRGAPSLPVGAVLCALGGAVASSTLSFVGPGLVSYGYLSVASRGGARARVVCLASMLVSAAVGGMLAGVSMAASAVVACLMALAFCELTASHRLTPGALCAVVGAGALALIGADELVALANGTTLSADVRSLVDALQQQLGDALVGSSAQLGAVWAAVELLWPVAYVMAALGSCVSALVGALVASRSSSDVARLPRLADFDLPLWVVAVLVASVAGIAFAVSVDGSASQVALALSANVAMAVRFALAAQGLAVLVWLARGKGLGPFTSTLMGVVALYLEVQFVVLTIAGLVDVWANFRHLDRGVRPGATGATMQD